MFFKSKFLARSVAAACVLSGSLYATDYTSTSFYVAYDGADATQYALVMPMINKVYTHTAGQIQPEDLTQVDDQFTSFPTYNNGTLCFPALANGATGDAGASVMAESCYDVDFFYTQKEVIPEGAAFMLYYDLADRVYEGLAGQPTTFLVVKDGDTITNENSITGEDYTSFTFDQQSATATLTSSVVNLPQETLPSSITGQKTLTNDKLWLIDGLVVVEDGATLTIEPGTTIAGYDGTADQTSYMIVDKGAQIIAEGTAEEPITFTSTKVAIDGAPAAEGQWGGLTIIGNAGNAQVKPYEANDLFVAGGGQDGTGGIVAGQDLADSSGILRHVKILNSGITMDVDKEINGLSFVGVGSGTIVEDITVDLSDDDGIELWGGTVNLSNINLTRCTDDYFDIDDGFSGVVSNLNITTTTGNAAIEMSGTTAATFDGFNIVQNGSAKEGGIYFKKDGIGGHFRNGTVTDNVDDTFGAIHSLSANEIDDTVDSGNISFENVTLNGATTGAAFTGTSAATLESIYNTVKPTATLPSSITAAMSPYELTKDTLWLIDGLVVVEDGATLNIEPGTTIAGYDGTADQTSYMIVDKGATINADGTLANPITFTSTKVAIDGAPAAEGQWGGLTIIGNAGNAQVKPYEANDLFVAGGGQDGTGGIVAGQDLADSSGILRHVKILNSGITMDVDKEINGLSFVGVGSGTIVEDITVDLSDDDGIELWGGTVNLSNINLTRCTDDYFDIDDGFSGIVSNLNITTTTGNAAIEMSGTTAATFDGFNIVQNGSAKEGGIYFKKDGIGGHFLNGTVIDNVDDGFGAIHSLSANEIDDTVDSGNISFENVTLNGATTGAAFTGTSAATLEAIYNGEVIKPTTTLPSSITAAMSPYELTKDTLYLIDGLVVVEDGATLNIEPGTTIAGYDGTADQTSYMIVDKGATINADGTATAPITFTSTKVAIDGAPAAEGQWGGLTIIGNAGNAQVKPYEANDLFVAGGGQDGTGGIVAGQDLADSSGILRHVKILNSGITMDVDKEINGLSFVGVGSGTIVEDITVDLSDDDGIELWGGTVNLSNINLTRCTDDYFDIDDGFSGIVSNLNITTTTGNAAIEMSGTTAATFDGFNIVQNGSAKEGGIYFKKDGIGGHFLNGTVIDNVDDGFGAIHSLSANEIDDTVDSGNISFENVTLNGATTGAAFTGTSDVTLEAEFNAGSENVIY